MIRALAVAAAVLAGGCASFHAGPLPNPPADATFVNVDGIHVRYIDQGQGPAVVLIHGYSSSLDLWRPTARALAKRHRVLAIDLKGFGWTSRPPGDYSPAAEARLAWHVLDARGVKKVALVGHSWGASVVMAMVLQHPERVTRVALYSGYVYDDQVPSFFHWARIGGVGEALFTLFYRQRIEDRIALAYYDDRFVTVEAFDRVRAELNRPGAVAAAMASARGQRYAAMETRYHTLEQPFLLVWGHEDRVAPITFAYRLLSELPHARLVELHHCGHIPMIEAHVRATAALVDFVDEDVQ